MYIDDWLVKSSFKENYMKQPHNKKKKSPLPFYVLFWKGIMPHSSAQSWVVKFSTGQTLVLFWHAAIEIHSNI